MTRTDIHSEKSLKPEDYEWVRWINTRPPEFSGWDVEGSAAAIKAHREDMEQLRAMMEAEGVNIHYGISNCDHCGARYTYGNVIRHKPTGQLLTIGDTCLEERFNMTNGAYHKKRYLKIEKANKARRKLSRKLLDYRRTCPDVLKLVNRHHKANGFMADVRAWMRKGAAPTDNQTAAVLKVAVAIEERAKQRVEEAMSAMPIPADFNHKRVTLCGTVLSTRGETTDFGYCLKMLVKDDRGFKVWGTAPSGAGSLRTDGKGKRVQFDAKLTISDRDPCFGFYKRPTKFSFIDQGE